MKENSKNKSTANVCGTDKTGAFLAFFVAGIIPFIVELVLSDSGLSVYDWFSKGSREVDFFLIWKKWWLIGTAAIMLVLMLARAARSFFCKNEPAWKREINRSFSYNRWIIVCSVLYIVTALISSCMAENKEYAFWGGYTNHQPFFVLASYVIVMIFTYFYVNSKEAILSFYKLFMAAVFTMALLGVFQFFGHDFFASMAGKRIITFFSDIDPAGVTLKFGEGRVYLTLYNPDYVGTYVSMVLPLVCAGLWIMKSIFWKCMSLLTSLMLVVCLIGSASTTGMTALIITAIMVFFINAKRIKTGPDMKKMILPVVSFVVLTAIMAAVNLNVIKEAFSKYIPKDDNFAIDGIWLENDCVCVRFKGEKLLISLDDGLNENGEDGVIKLSDASGNTLPGVYDADYDGILVEDDSFAGIVIKSAEYPDEWSGFSICYDNKSYSFARDPVTGRYMYYNIFGKMTDKISNRENDLFKNHEQFASGRGFIWSRSLPLLKKNVLWGCGPDNYVFEFPNDDYVGLLNNNYAGEVVTRPHNMYIQMGIQTGVISLILFLAAYVLYFINSVKIYLQNEEQMSAVQYLVMAVLAGSFAYMICGLANDSTVCVTPVFAVLVGIGMAGSHVLAIGSRNEADLHNE